MGLDGQTPLRHDFADRLTKELEATTEVEDRKALLYALLRVLETDPDAEREPFEYLDLAVAEDPDATDLVWEEWRAAVKRPPKRQLLALKRIFGTLGSDTEKAHCHLLIARLYNEHFHDPKLARRELEKAEALSPELREIMWALAESDATLGHVDLITTRLEKVAALTRDPVFRAALLIEIAELKLKDGGDLIAVSGLLNRALKEAGIDWSLIHAILRLSAENEQWELHEKALSKLADAAAAPPEGADSGGLAGHDFDGFERGRDVVAALYWYLAVVRETRLGSVERAFEAMSRAATLLPENIYLKRESGRLLALLGRTVDALDQLPENESNAVRAQIALIAGSVDMAASLGAQERDVTGSLLSEILAEGSRDDLPPPQCHQHPETLMSWLETHVSHSEAAPVAETLKELGVDYPLIDVVLEEARSRKQSLISLLRADTGCPWAHALNGLFGEGESRATAFAAWADSMADDSLRATLLFVAANVAAAEGADALASELDAQAEKLAAESTAGRHAFDPTPENFANAASALADEAADAADLYDKRVDLFKRAMIQEHALGDIAAASETVDNIRAISKGDTAALFLAIRLAARGGDWTRVAECLHALSDLVPADKTLFSLFAGEIELFHNRRFQRALDYFEDLIQSADEAVRETGRLYRSLALRQLDQEEVLKSSLQRESLPPPRMADLVPPDVRDANVRMLSAVQAMSQLEGLDDDATRGLLEQMVFGLAGGDLNPGKLNGVSRKLGKLAERSPDSTMADALRATAALLGGTPVKTDFIQNESDVVSKEALWYIVDRLPSTEDPYLKVKIIADRMTDVSQIDEYDRMDMMIALAEAKERAGDMIGALDTIQSGLESASTHPGMLEAKARLATQAERFIEAADTHGRLAGFYHSQAEKAHHLAQAALILFDKLENPKGARRICEEAIRRVPGHAQANDVLDYIFRSCFDDTTAGDAAPGERRYLPIQDAVSDAASDVEVIIEDDQSDIVAGEEGYQLAQLRDRAALDGDELAVWSYDDLLALLGGELGMPRPVSPLPNPYWDHGVVRDICEHPRDAVVASEIARLTADIAPPGLEGAYTRPRSADTAAGDRAMEAGIAAWCRMWGAAAGLGEFEIVFLDNEDIDVAAFQPEDNLLFVSTRITFPFSADHQFALATLLWRAARGLCAFPKGDIVGPVRWVISVASSVLGVTRGLPLPVKPDYVDRAEIAILDTVREALVEPCTRLLEESSIALRVWAEATSFSADRFGVLALGQASEAVRIVIQESEGAEGVEALRAAPSEVIHRVPRARELWAFVLSKAYLETRATGYLDVFPTGGRG